MSVSGLERLVYICTCPKGKQPHIHWDMLRNEPEKLDRPEAVTQETPVEKPR